MSKDSDLTVFRVNALRVDRNYHESMFRTCMIAADLWSKHTDPYAVAAAAYFRNMAIEWASK